MQGLTLKTSPILTDILAAKSAITSLQSLYTDIVFWYFFGPVL